MKRADRIAALVLAGVCVYAWLAARTFSPLSALFPRVIVVILGALALMLFALSYVKPGQGRVFVLVEGNALPLALAVAMMVAWVALIAVIGFLVTSLVVFSMMTVVLEGRPKRGSPGGVASVRRIVVRVALVCAITVAFYLFFERLLLVGFPRGLLI